MNTTEGRREAIASRLLLQPHEAAERAGVHERTIRRWADMGLLPYTLTAGGHRRYRPEDLDQLIRRATA